MIEKVEQFIKSQKLFEKDEKLLVAVSGGVDSMVLLYVLSKLGYKVSAAHVNFKLRTPDSDEDQQFVTEWCAKRGIPVHTQSFNTREYLKDASDSVQMIARKLRYEWMEKLMEEQDFTKLVVGHHVSDSLETTLYNLVKGTGIKGIRGIMAESHNVVRPLINCNKDDISSFAKENNIPWREDSTNLRSDYYRNYIRNEVIPKLRTINPSLENTFIYTQNRLKDAESIVAQAVAKIEEANVTETDDLITINASWMDYQEGASYILSEILSRFGFNYKQSLDISEARDHTGSLFSSGTYKLLVNRGNFELELDKDLEEVHVQIGKDESKETAHGFVETRVLQMEQEFEIPTLKQIACLDFNKVQLPMTIRNWQKGDRFIPLGMNGFKKVSDFLIDEKVSTLEKEKIMVLVSGEDICWLIGHRLDDRFKITPDTTQLCVVKFDPGNPG